MGDIAPLPTLCQRMEVNFYPSLQKHESQLHNNLSHKSEVYYRTSLKGILLESEIEGFVSAVETTLRIYRLCIPQMCTLSEDNLIKGALHLQWSDSLHPPVNEMVVAPDEVSLLPKCDFQLYKDLKKEHQLKKLLGCYILTIQSDILTSTDGDHSYKKMQIRQPVRTIENPKTIRLNYRELFAVLRLLLALILLPMVTVFVSKLGWWSLLYNMIFIPTLAADGLGFIFSRNLTGNTLKPSDAAPFSLNSPN